MISKQNFSMWFEDKPKRELIAICGLYKCYINEQISHSNKSDSKNTEFYLRNA